ncbi:hypothetical protein BGY98DRAFT_353316 [Russula aff. rugulosa BPL654]|nr:hypothetical protein BGY98DRAFT_353316 [Russula aff. rugulosa BPL654]
MYGFNTFAYTHLQFLPPNSLFSLARSVHRLAEVLACSPHYRQAVRTLRISGWNVINLPDGYNIGVVYNALDEGVTTILNNAPHINSLTLDLILTRGVHRFSRTFATLTRLRTVRNLRLTMFHVPMCTAENESLQELERIPDDQAPPAYERVSLRVHSGVGLPVIMQDPRKLRWFWFGVLEKGWNRGDNNWELTLRRVAEAATEIETLILENVFVSEAVFSILVADHDGMNGYLILGTRGPQKAEVIFDIYDDPLPSEPEATLLWLLSFFGHALENRHQPLRNMASRHRSSIYS